MLGHPDLHSKRNKMNTKYHIGRGRQQTTWFAAGRVTDRSTR